MKESRKRASPKKADEAKSPKKSKKTPATEGKSKHGCGELRHRNGGKETKRWLLFSILTTREGGSKEGADRKRGIRCHPKVPE